MKSQRTNATDDIRSNGSPSQAQNGNSGPEQNDETDLIRITAPNSRKQETSEQAGKRKRWSNRERTLQKDRKNNQVAEIAVDPLTAKVEPRKSSWTLSSPTAGRYSGRDPIFVQHTNGEEYVVAATTREVHVLSVKTSLLIRALTAPDDLTIVTFDALSQGYDSSVHVVYSNGQVVKWDWLSNLQESSKPQNRTIQAYRIAKLNEADESLSVTHEGPSSKFHLDNKLVHTSTRHIKDLQILGNFDFVVGRCEKAIVAGMKGAAGEFVWIELPLKTHAICVDARIVDTGTSGKQNKPFQSALSLAIGNADGQIHLYPDIAPLFASKGAVTLPNPRILHWHRDAVSSVKFSRDGNYLISGGSETVLVLWQLETGHRSFLPHLTSEIERIVVNPTGNRYAVQMGDNSIIVLSTTELKPIANFAGLQLPVRPNSDKYRPGLATTKTVAALHPQRTKEMLLTVPSTQPKTAGDITSRPFLQTFDLQTARHITRQALTRNNVTDFNLGPERTPIIPPDVVLLAIARDGRWLATVDEWTPPMSDVAHLATEAETADDVQMRRREVYLKFWLWDDEAQTWTLSTRVDEPHARVSGGRSTAGAGRVFGLVADPARLGFVSVGEDSAVKIWRPKRRTRHGVAMTNARGEEEIEWVCRTVVELEKEGERTAAVMAWEEELVEPSGAALAVSDDGSLIAASMCYDRAMEDLAASGVCFIDAETGEIKTSRDNVAADNLVELAFADRYLIALSQKALRVWDVVDDKLHYSAKVAADGVEARQAGGPLLAINRMDRTIAVATRQTQSGGGKLVVREIGRAKPLCTMELEQGVEALLADGQGRSFVVVFADATIRTLSFSGGITRAAAAAAGDSALLTADIETENVASEPSEVGRLLGPATGGEEVRGGLIADVAEDDRRVVRPEQLAKIFDVGAGAGALPSVREMFRSVAGLYGRKPRTGVVEA